MKRDQSPDVDRIFKEGRLVDAAVRRAVRAAVRRHWEAGFPVAEWRDGKVVWIGPGGRVVPRPRKQRTA